MLKKIQQIVQKFIAKYGWIKLIFLLIFFLLLIIIVKFFGRDQREALVRVEVLPDRWQYGERFVSLWMSEKIEIGDKEYNPTGESTAEIIQADIYDQWDEKKKVYLVLKLKALQDKKTQILKYKGNAVQVNKVLHFSFPQYQFDARVLAVGQSSIREKKKLLVTVRKKEVDNYLLNSLESGLTAFNRGSDQPVAVLKDFKVMPTKSQIFTTFDNDLKLERDPTKKDLEMEFELLVDVYQQELLYAGHQKVKQGEFLWIYTDEIDLEKSEVMKIKTQKKVD